MNSGKSKRKICTVDEAKEYSQLVKRAARFMMNAEVPSTVLHITEAPEWESFPQVVQNNVRWGKISADAALQIIEKFESIKQEALNKMSGYYGFDVLAKFEDDLTSLKDFCKEAIDGEGQ